VSGTSPSGWCAPRLTDHPWPVDREAYVIAVERMVNRLSAWPGLAALYQIGHVSTPGISDLDLIAVFQDDATCLRNPREGLSRTERYLFVHDLFGARLSHFIRAAQVTCFHNYQLLWGSAPADLPPPPDDSDRAQLQQQIALEYLVRAYVSLSVELTYGIVKIRNLFLHTRALLYDCEFLGVTTGPLLDSIKVLVDRRTRWFEAPPPPAVLGREILDLHAALGEFLADILRRRPLFLPGRAEHRVAGNLRLAAGDRLVMHHRGVRLPRRLAFLGRRYFNLQHRLNRFEFVLPFQTRDLPRTIQKVFEVQHELREDNRRHLPCFMPLTSSLTLQ
jgi:hypothetical protein